MLEAAVKAENREAEANRHGRSREAEWKSPLQVGMAEAVKQNGDLPRKAGMAEAVKQMEICLAKSAWPKP